MAANHTAPIKFADLPSMKATVIVTCMDPRADPKDFWDPKESGNVAIIRNVGGTATEDVLRSIRFLAGVMSNGRNTVGAVAVVHHTDCGLSHFSDVEVKEGLKKQVGLEGLRATEVDSMKFSD